MRLHRWERWARRFSREQRPIRHNDLHIYKVGITANPGDQESKADVTKSSALVIAGPSATDSNFDSDFDAELEAAFS